MTVSPDTGFRLERCTVQLRSGAFCDKPVPKVSPFSVCSTHLLQIANWVHHPDFRVSELADRDSRLQARQLRDGEWEQPPAPRSFVYYVLMPHHLVKVGVSTNVRQRLASLRVTSDALLAVEPGDGQLERHRHRQFAHLAERWNEEFRPGPDLVAHT